MQVVSSTKSSTGSSTREHDQLANCPRPLPQAGPAQSATIGLEWAGQTPPRMNLCTGPLVVYKKYASKYFVFPNLCVYVSRPH